MKNYFELLKKQYVELNERSLRKLKEFGFQDKDLLYLRKVNSLHCDTKPNLKDLFGNTEVEKAECKGYAKGRAAGEKAQSESDILNLYTWKIQDVYEMQHEDKLEDDYKIHDLILSIQCYFESEMVLMEIFKYAKQDYSKNIAVMILDDYEVTKEYLIYQYDDELDEENYIKLIESAGDTKLITEYKPTERELKILNE